MLARDEIERPIPLEWRITFQEIADAFANGDFALQNHPVDRVAPIDQPTSKFIASCVAGYGDSIAPLQSATWERSCYLWMDGYWQFLVDLSTDAEEVSDLTLHAILREGDNTRLEIQSIHVP
ncbi:MAG TPA: hypothetical protein PKD48_03020 [Sphingopyxis sp.]|nr:hypothetical protein [Sphingopyxis sp.]